MGATVGEISTGHPPPRLRRRSVFWPTATGLVWATVGLIPLSVVLFGVPLAPHFEVRPRPGFGTVFLPWELHGAFSVIGALGWGSLMAAYVSGCIRAACARAGLTRPSRGWCWVAVAVGGYGAASVHGTATGRALAAGVAIGLLTGWLAYHRDGQAREWPWRASRRIRLGGLAFALGLALAYSVTHAMAGELSASQGEGFGRAPAPYLNSAWVTLSASPFPVEITAVRVEASPGLRLHHVLLQRGDVGAGLITHGTHLPFHLPAFSELTISAGLVGCRQHGHLTSVEVHYRELGLPFAFTLVLGESQIDNRCAG